MRRTASFAVSATLIALLVGLAFSAGPAAGRGLVGDLLASLIGSTGGEEGGGGGSLTPAKPLGGTLRTATTGNNSEVVKTIPIARKANAKKRVVMSLGPGALGELRPGDVLYATGEAEVSVCLKPNPLHRSSRPCVGRQYGYDPTVRGRLVLASGAKATGGRNSVTLARRSLKCTQTQPDRNHHCVLVMDNGVLRIPGDRSLPCNANTCHVNLVLAASHRAARSGHRLVIGAASDGRKVNGDKGRINVSRFRPGRADHISPTVARKPVRRRLPIEGEGGDVNQKPVFSIALPNLRAGEQLVIDGRLVTRIGMHTYNVFHQSSLVLSEGPRSASRNGWPMRVGDLNGQAGEANGFNCTQGASAHRNPCKVRKVGVLEITRDAPKTLYLNLGAGLSAQADFRDHHGSGDSARISGGFLRVYRYPRDRNDSPPPVRD